MQANIVCPAYRYSSRRRINTEAKFESLENLARYVRISLSYEVTVENNMYSSYSLLH